MNFINSGLNKYCIRAVDIGTGCRPSAIQWNLYNALSYHILKILHTIFCILHAILLRVSMYLVVCESKCDSAVENRGVAEHVSENFTDWDLGMRPKCT